MAKLTLIDKVERCTHLLLGLRHRQVQQALITHGFSRDVIQQGWQLITEVGLARAASKPGAPKPSADPGRDPLRELVELQDTWFPVARASLKAHFPDLAVALFSGLTRQRGNWATLSMATFFSRLRDLAEGAAPYGVDGPAARQLLLQRGLTPAVEEQAQAALNLWRDIVDEQDESSEPIAAEEAALAQLWTFYTEWSGIAQAALTNQSHLRWLGLGLAERRATRKVATKVVQVDVFTQRPALLGR
jgi:hypothetical protein